MAKKIIKKKIKKVVKRKVVKKKLVSAKGGQASGWKKVVRKAKPVKKAVRKIIRPKKTEGKLVGRVVHFFSNIDVAVIKFSAPVKLGDEIRIVGGENTDFNQKIKSIQFDHKELRVAKKGKEVGMKVKEKVRDGYRVYKV